MGSWENVLYPMFWRENVKKGIVRNFFVGIFVAGRGLQKDGTYGEFESPRKILAFRVGVWNFFSLEVSLSDDKGRKKYTMVQLLLNKTSLAFNIPQRRTFATKSGLTKKLKTCRCYAVRSDPITSRADCVFLYTFPRTNDEYLEQKLVNKAREAQRNSV